MTLSSESKLIQKNFDLEHHTGYRVVGQFVFGCLIKKHAYHCEQPFDYCPSCGLKIEKSLKGAST